MNKIHITVGIITMALVSCQIKQSKTIAETAKTPVEDAVTTENKHIEARDNTAKLAKTYLLQDKVSNVVEADYETSPVTSTLGEDAADDPAIWINKSNPEKSMIIGTNKKAGLHVYDLHGNELQFVAIGKMNNADVSYDLKYQNKNIDIVAGSNRSNNSIEILQIDTENLKLIETPILTIPSTLDEVYGFCLYHNTTSGKQYAFVNSKNGKIEQWYLNNESSELSAQMVRSLWVSSQPEGMVVDPITNTLYVGVEEDAIYKFNAQAEADTMSTRLNESGENNLNINYDIEGLSIYRTSDTKGYLIASIQGNFTYAIFDLYDHNKYITSFKIKDGIYDGVEETDGIDVTNIPLGKEFPKGILVVQDGFNKDGDTELNQNFKVVSFDKILKFLK